MSNHEPPTLGEIMRRLDTIATQQAELIREIKADRVDAAKTYVRQDVYLRAEQMTNALIADTRADIAVVDGKVEDDRKNYSKDRASDAANRRATLFWLGGLSVTLLLGVAGLIVSVLTG